MCQSYNAVEVVRTFANGSKEISIEVTCDRCNGNGVFQHLKHVDRGLCYKCGGTGVIEKTVKTNIDDIVQMVSRTTDIKSIEPANDNEAIRKALIDASKERKEKRQAVLDSLKREEEERKQHEEDIKNNPDDYRFTWDD